MPASFFPTFFVTHISHIQCTEGRGNVRVASKRWDLAWMGKRRDGICPVAKMTGGDLPEMGIVRTPLMRRPTGDESANSGPIKKCQKLKMFKKLIAVCILNNNLKKIYSLFIYVLRTRNR